MARPRHPTVNFASSHYIESAGCIQFVPPKHALNPSSHAKVTLIKYPHHLRHDRPLYLLAKGRRNVTEHRATAGLREASEESGLASSLIPIRLHSRCPPAVEETSSTPDAVRTFDGVIEPFMMSVRDLGSGQLKVMWWFVAEVDESQPAAGSLKGSDAQECESVMVDFEEALGSLTFECDREVLREGIKVWEETKTMGKRA